MLRQRPRPTSLIRRWCIPDSTLFDNMSSHEGMMMQLSAGYRELSQLAPFFPLSTVPGMQPVPCYACRLWDVVFYYRNPILAYATDAPQTLPVTEGGASEAASTTASALPATRSRHGGHHITSAPWVRTGSVTCHPRLFNTG